MVEISGKVLPCPLKASHRASFSVLHDVEEDKRTAQLLPAAIPQLASGAGEEGREER